MLISQLDKILNTIEKYHHGDRPLSDVAHALDMPFNQLQALLSWNNVLDGLNRPHPHINYQDIVNVITLYFAMKPTHKFTFIAFGDPEEGYVKATEERITTQEFRKPAPTR